MRVTSPRVLNLCWGSSTLASFGQRNFLVRASRSFAVANDDSVADVTMRAAQTLGRVGGPEAYDVLVAAYEKQRPRSSQRRRIAAAIGNTKDPRAPQFLLKLLKHADSEELTDYGIKLFRNANANTEIIGDVLETLHGKNPQGPNPFSQRNIILGLITGMLGDTVGGKVIHYKEDYDLWMEKLGDRLKEITRWRGTDDKRGEDCQTSKFGDPKQILDYLKVVT